MTKQQIEAKAKEIANLCDDCKRNKSFKPMCKYCESNAAYKGAIEMAEWILGNIWHNGKLEKPKTSEIFYVSDEGGCGAADYDAENDRFDAVDECYYSGDWDRCHIKQWAYLDDILPMEGGKQ